MKKQPAQKTQKQKKIAPKSKESTKKKVPKSKPCIPCSASTPSTKWLIIKTLYSKV